MSRDSRLYVADILSSIQAIQTYLQGFSRETLEADPRTRDAILRNLELIGEAVKHLPPAETAGFADVDWSGFVRLRDVLIHQYFGIDLDIVWDAVVNELPLLEAAVREMSRRFPSRSE